MMWFVADTDSATLTALDKAEAIVVESTKFRFGQSGVELPKTEGEAAAGKVYSTNLRVYAKEGYTASSKAFSIVSYS